LCSSEGDLKWKQESLNHRTQRRNRSDVPLTDRIERSPAFYEKYADDPLRSLIMPVW
jgi:hypothetical protein